MSGIFINYRNDDEPYAAALIDEELKAWFGKANVFRASRSIPPAHDFERSILDRLRTSSVFIAVIGKRWLGAVDAASRRRIDDPADWVRLELRTAFERGIPVLPVLVTDVKLPLPASLPPDIAALGVQQYVRLHHRNVRFDLLRLVTEIGNLVPELALCTLIDEKPPPSPFPSTLLRADYAIVPFAGRDAELGTLIDWCLGSAPSAFRLVMGPGGRGKTRLAHELCVALHGREWTVGFLSDRVERSALERFSQVRRPTLLVIDHAEARPDQVLATAEALARRDVPAAPVRVLLLARSAGDWIRALRAHPDDRVAALLFATEEHELNALLFDGDARRAEVLRAVEAFTPYIAPRTTSDAAPSAPGDASDMLSVAGVATGAANDTTNDTADDTAISVGLLELHAQALAHVLDRSVPDGSTDDDPLRRVLHHEQWYWDATASAVGLPDPHPERIWATVAALSLFGADSDGEATRLLAALRTFRHAGTDVVDRYVSWLRMLYPGVETITPLRPDRLAEDHVAATLATQPSLVQQVVAVVDDRQASRAIRVLASAAARHTSAATALSALLDTSPARMVPLAIRVATYAENAGLLADAISATLVVAPAPDALTAATKALPHASVSLAQLALTVARMSRDADSGNGSPDSTDVARTAQLDHDFARRAVYAGGHEIEARAAAEAAAAGFRAVAAEDERFLPRLAEALSTLATCLADLGQHTAALAAVVESVDVYRQIERRRPGRFRAALATALHNLAVFLKEQEEEQDAAGTALAAVAEAVELARSLAREQPSPHLPLLAGCLDTLAVQLHAHGSLDDAIAAATEATDIRRELARRRPDPHLPALATSLSNLAVHLGLGEERSFDAVTEAVAVYRRLATVRPARYRPELTTAAYNLAEATWTRGRHKDALEIMDECVAIRRGLAAERPERFLGPLTAALDIRASWLAEQGRTDEASADLTELAEHSDDRDGQ